MKSKKIKVKNSKAFDWESRLSATLMYIFLISLALLVLYPFIYALGSSFKEPTEILTSSSLLPKRIQFGNYVQAWKLANFSTYTFNSAWYSALMVTVIVLSSTIGGYVFARGEFRGRNLFFGIFTALMFICLGSSSMYPTLEIFKKLHLNTSLFGLIVRQMFGINITNIYLVRSFMAQIPKELDEAAAIDGCDFIRTFIKIMLPLLKPIIATVAIFAFSTAWNDYLWPMVVTLGNPAQRTLSVGMVALKATSEAATAWNLILAGGMISALPMIIVFTIFNRYFIKGLAAGAVKG